MKLGNTLNTISRLILPSSNIAGLQITNSSIRFLELREQGGKIFNARSASLRLPPGILEEGRVKDKANFIAALKTLHNQIDPNPRNIINVILTIPTGDVYAQSFNVPAVAKENIEETAELNMQVISPNPIENSYYSWMVVADKSSGGGQIELLGAFVGKEVIHELISMLEEANFGVAAVEFSSLSMVRLLTFYNIIRTDTSYILVKLTQEGLIFMVIRNGNLYFDYFRSWEKVAEEKGGVSLDAIMSIVYAEMRRVLNFYASHWGDQIKNIVLISPTMLDQISKFLASSFPGFSISILSSEKENLHGVRGAALRGLKPRATDGDLSLMDPASINAFLREQVISFIKFWRNIIITVSVFIFALFGLTDLLLRGQSEQVRESFNLSLLQPGSSELALLQSRAQDFNSIVGTLSRFKDVSPGVSPLTEKITGAAPSGVVISRLNIQVLPDKSGIIDGLSKDQNSIVEFKNNLLKVAELTEVNLPLANINTQPNGQVSFVITFKLQGVVTSPQPATMPRNDSI